MTALKRCDKLRNGECSENPVYFGGEPASQGDTGVFFFKKCRFQEEEKQNSSRVFLYETEAIKTEYV